MDIEELNAKNEALITLLSDAVESIDCTKDKIKDYEFNRLANSLFYIIGELSGNTKQIKELLTRKEFKHNE
ncbi:MAG TPA: hypothetical protein H9861_01200 [Candidatus Ligilactobacillus excrementigallinarum]|uniref:Uncharacterized protein n=1 Tax=Candidatus Ligilactobacillus excrementigallinarum TaxID=2838641 RepID=A0A9D2A937_9LACO|nr:hypothetical protein [Candidatus Ligilactobacillus excrementigallinarum]